MSVTVGVLGDTHVPMRARTLPAAAWRALADAEVLLHTGDVCVPSLLDEIAALAPLHVAMGNVDTSDVRAWGARDVVEVTLEGANVVLLHDAGRRDGRAARLRRRFPRADVVVFGHSHQPLVEREGDLLLVNPGSPTDKRRAPDHTVAILRIEDGRASANLVVLER